MPSTRPDPPSLLRQIAYQQYLPLPGPVADPEGWKVLRPVTARGTFFQTKRAEVRCTVSPLCHCMSLVTDGIFRKVYLAKPVSMIHQSQGSQSHLHFSCRTQEALLFRASLRLRAQIHNHSICWQRRHQYLSFSGAGSAITISLCYQDNRTSPGMKMSRISGPQCGGQRMMPRVAPLSAISKARFAYPRI